MTKCVKYFDTLFELRGGKCTFDFMLNVLFFNVLYELRTFTENFSIKFEMSNQKSLLKAKN